MTSPSLSRLTPGSQPLGCAEPPVMPAHAQLSRGEWEQLAEELACRPQGSAAIAERSGRSEGVRAQLRAGAAGLRGEGGQ